ncbi:MAG: hypothetical protein K2K90_18555 [Lachnospiraceae bacterium]|nr:hypothetical protein [Lachnospiraceae bacterium]
MIKKIFLYFLWIISIWYIVITVVNAKAAIPPKLLLYDLFTGFRDNRIYLVKIFLPVTVLVILLTTLFALLLESNLVVYWNVRIRKLSFHIGDIRFFRNHKKLLMFLSFGSTAVLLAIPSYRQLRRNTLDTWTGALTIAHAGGIIDGHDYTNSLEAILSNYGKGQRVFEIDFARTIDNQLVCTHGWDPALLEDGTSDEEISAQKFMSTLIRGQYTPLSLEELGRLMEQYPDLWVVTDTKNSAVESVQQDFEILRDTMKEHGMEFVLDRMIIQIYNEEMYHTVYRIYPFKSWIYTLYKFWGGDTETFLQCVRFCYGHDINGITTWNFYVTPELLEITKAYGIPWYAHTENDVKNADELIRQGLSGIYTDSITPDMLKLQSVP